MFGLDVQTEQAEQTNRQNGQNRQSKPNRPEREPQPGARAPIKATEGTERGGGR